MQELVGRHGPYRLGEVVARGRSGEVYRALDADAQPVAIKVYDRAAECDREIDALRAVAAVQVVRLHDAGETLDGRRWIATPWIEGRTLAHVLATEGPLSLERANRIVEQLAAAIDALHAAGIVHGDVSPRNVMVDLHDRATLIDLATSSQPGSIIAPLDTTAPIEVDGTPRYTAPEVAAGGAVEAASDRYAVGLIAYESITGAFPFPDVATPIAMLAHHAGTEPIAPSEHRPSLSSSVDDVVLRSLDKSPAERPQTAREIAAGLVDSAATDLSPVRRLSVVAAVLVACLLLGAGAIVARSLASNDDADAASDASVIPASISALDAPGAPGRALGVACNLLEQPGFEPSDLVDHFYAGDSANSVVRSPDGGVGDSSALDVGADGRYGLFGEVVPIDHLTTGTANSSFVFSVWARPHDGPVQAGIYVDYLTDDFRQLTFERDALSIEVIGDLDGARVTVVSEVPAGAAFAVPTVFKDGSDGSLLIDEAVFASATRCAGVAE